MHMFLYDVRLYFWLISMQIRAQWQYKFNLFLDIVTYFGVTALEIISLLLFFIPFPTLLGWKVGEVALLGSIMSISFGLAELVGAGIDNFGDMVRRGEFDRILLRPIGAFTQVIGSDFRLRRLGRITQGGAGIVVALWFLPNLHWTLTKVLVLSIGILSGTVIFVAILLLGATICFWTIETTELTNMLTYGAREMLSYPLTIYNLVLQRIFLFVFPVAFGTFVPACYILGRPLPFNMPGEVAFLAPIIALIFALIASQIWRLGMRRYQSTGS